MAILLLQRLGFAFVFGMKIIVYGVSFEEEGHVGREGKMRKGKDGERERMGIKKKQDMKEGSIEEDFEYRAWCDGKIGREGRNGRTRD